MTYAVTNPQPSNLAIPIAFNGEAKIVAATAVTLDTGDLVAIAALCGVQSNTGDVAMIGSSRVINADGTDKLDATGQPIVSGFSHVTNATEIAQAGSVQAVQKCVLLALLGEGTSPLWQDAIHQTVLANASIRTNIASASHAGPVATGSLL